ncbi:PREDICTED: uncharacterized protein LOC105143751 [Acromyrmex echinatior]|uniref:uncharacterized protein LOC105143751 n=1 Tax=Acromyrmex echinatior TaxID=103372 RepID=UPI000580CF24|nr:PREDICTED: uncharacterized protein LOC105143751 [Acromyrmex echinatior]
MKTKQPYTITLFPQQAHASDKDASKTPAKSLRPYLADHQYKLSLARRAFIKPALNLLDKSTADLVPIDEWLFGASFMDKVKDAQACEKVAPRQSSRSNFQNPFSVGGKGPIDTEASFAGNAKAPARIFGNGAKLEISDCSPPTVPLPKTLLRLKSLVVRTQIWNGSVIQQPARFPWRQGVCGRLKQVFQGVPQRAVDTIIASLAPSTICQYSSPLRSWWKYAHRHHCSLFTPETKDVLLFLSGLSQTVRSYSTLNVARSRLFQLTRSATNLSSGGSVKASAWSHLVHATITSGIPPR